MLYNDVKKIIHFLPASKQLRSLGKGNPQTYISWRE